MGSGLIVLSAPHQEVGQLKVSLFEVGIYTQRSAKLLHRLLFGLQIEKDNSKIIMGRRIVRQKTKHLPVLLDCAFQIARCGEGISEIDSG